MSVSRVATRLRRSTHWRQAILRENLRHGQGRLKARQGSFLDVAIYVSVCGVVLRRLAVSGWDFLVARRLEV